MDPSRYATSDPNLIFDQLERERRLALDEYSKERNRALFRDTSAKLATLTPAAQDGPSDVASDMHRYLNKFTDEDGVRWSEGKSGWVARIPVNASPLTSPTPRQYVTIKTPLFDVSTERAVAILADTGVPVRTIASVVTDGPATYLLPRYDEASGRLLGGLFMIDAEAILGA